MKKFFLSVFFVFCVLNAFSSGGNVFHNKKLSVLKTEYFDIIFCDETFEDAKKIALAADSYYLEITKKFGAEQNLRFPVSITREVQSLNGFYSPFPYNMIVLYAAEPDSPEMESYSDTLLSVFYHELTHAVTMNMKSPVFQKLSKIFGDFASSASVSMPYFWIEGVAVFSESEKNEEKSEENGGRLKNPYFTSLIVQAKINEKAGVKKFPSWRDVFGARDTTPGGTDRYVFGGCFAEYLVQNYGMKKYAELWKNAGDSADFSFSAGVFKRTYGIKIDEVWENFKNSIKIPKDFSSNIKNQNANLLSKKNSFVKTFALFYDKKSKSTEIAFYDSASHAVFYYKKDSKSEKSDSKKKSKSFPSLKKLFSASAITNLEFSDDGEKIFITKYSAKKTIKIENGVFDIAKKKYKILRGENEFYKKAYIEKSALKWEIVFNGKKYSAGEKIILANPHFTQTDEKNVFISFSWANFGENDDFQNLSLPKCGALKINLEDGKGIFYLQKKSAVAENRIHSVNDAALFDFNDFETKFFAVLEDYEANPLYEISFPPFSDEEFWQKIPSDSKNLEKPEIIKNSEDFDFSSNSKKIEDSKSKEFEKSETDEEKLCAQKFSNLPYLVKGTKIPLGIVPLKSGGFENVSSAILGATYVTSKPFLSDFLVFSAGFDPVYNDGGAFFSFFDYDESQNFSFSSSLVFDSKIFKQAAADFVFSKTLHRGLISQFSLGISSSAIYGRTAAQDFSLVDRGKTIEKGDFWEKGFFENSRFYFSYSNFHKVSPKYNQILGIKIQPFLDFEYKNYRLEWKFDDFDKIYSANSKTDEKYFNAGFYFLSRFPGIFPLSLELSLFPSSSYFAFGAAEFNLFNVEIQKGIPAVSLYAARFNLSASYSGRFSFEHENFFDILRAGEIISEIQKEDYSDKIALSALFTFSPNTGYFADSSVQFKIGASLYYLLSEENYGIKMIGSFDF